jgi:hypothetical protein
VEEQRARDATTVEYGELPELTRALRALGSSRRGGSSQLLLFGPLLEARRRAADARSVYARVRAFSAGDLNRSLERAIERIVADWPDPRPAARRALRHELVERVEGYSAALRELDQWAASAVDADENDRLPAWRRWTRQLLRVFESADRAWLAIRPVVEALPKTEIGKRQGDTAR